MFVAALQQKSTVSFLLLAVDRTAVKNKKKKVLEQLVRFTLLHKPALLRHKAVIWRRLFFFPCSWHKRQAFVVVAFGDRKANNKERECKFMALMFLTSLWHYQAKKYQVAAHQCCYVLRNYQTRHCLWNKMFQEQGPITRIPQEVLSSQSRLRLRRQKRPLEVGISGQKTGRTPTAQSSKFNSTIPPPTSPPHPLSTRPAVCYAVY